MTKKRLSAMTIAAALTFAATSVGATPLAYDEAVSGDLPESSGFPLLQLDVGVNTVSGTDSVSFPVGGPNAADFDSFEFSVPTGTHVTAISYGSTITHNTASEPFLIMEAFIDTAPAFAALGCEEFYIIGSPSPACLVPPLNTTFNSPLPLEAGDYLLFEGKFTASAFGETDWNYTWTLTVEPVPEPASIASLATSVAVLGAFALRRRRAV